MAEFFRVQSHDCPNEMTVDITGRAYEVYCHIHTPQPGIERGGRGGLAIGEIVAFLYARSFPKDEWRERAREAFAMQRRRP